MDPSGPTTIVQPVQAKQDVPIQVADGFSATAFDWRPLLRLSAIAYLFGVAVSLAWLAIGWIATLRLALRSQPVETHGQRCLRELAGDNHQVSLLSSDKVTTPLTLVRWRPTIIVPTWLLRPDAVRHLRWSLAHELSHIERRDHLNWLLFAVTRAVYFFHPFVWIIGRRLHLDQDFLADDRVALDDKKVADYAEFLTALAAPKQISATWQLGIVPGKTQLYRRVVMLLEENSLKRRLSKSPASVASRTETDTPSLFARLTSICTQLPQSSCWVAASRAT